MHKKRMKKSHDTHAHLYKYTSTSSLLCNQITRVSGGDASGGFKEGTQNIPLAKNGLITPLVTSIPKVTACEPDLLRRTLLKNLNAPKLFSFLSSIHLGCSSVLPDVLQALCSGYTVSLKDDIRETTTKRKTKPNCLSRLSLKCISPFLVIKQHCSHRTWKQCFLYQRVAAGIPSE